MKRAVAGKLSGGKRDAAYAAVGGPHISHTSPTYLPHVSHISPTYLPILPNPNPHPHPSQVGGPDEDDAVPSATDDAAGSVSLYLPLYLPASPYISEHLPNQVSSDAGEEESPRIVVVPTAPTPGMVRRVLTLALALALALALDLTLTQAQPSPSLDLPVTLTLTRTLTP